MSTDTWVAIPVEQGITLFTTPPGIEMTMTEFTSAAVWFEQLIMPEIQSDGSLLIMNKMEGLRPFYRKCLKCDKVDFISDYKDPILCSLTDGNVAMLGKCQCLCCRGCVFEEDLVDGWVRCPNCLMARSHCIESPLFARSLRLRRV